MVGRLNETCFAKGECRFDDAGVCVVDVCAGTPMRVCVVDVCAGTPMRVCVVVVCHLSASANDFDTRQMARAF